jgi:hypothetical protein
MKAGMQMVNSNTIMKLEGKLKEILELELKAGNTVEETYEGDWPLPNSIIVFLGKPFITPIQRNLPNIEFRNINDPHYWKAEYSDKSNRMWLCCRFNGPNFDLL